MMDVIVSGILGVPSKKAVFFSLSTPLDAGDSQTRNEPIYCHGPPLTAPPLLETT